MKTNINKNAFYVVRCFIFLSRDSLLKDSAVYKTDLCCAGSKSGDKAFESDAMDTGNMMGGDGVGGCFCALGAEEEGWR